MDCNNPSGVGTARSSCKLYGGYETATSTDPRLCRGKKKKDHLEVAKQADKYTGRLELMGLGPLNFVTYGKYQTLKIATSTSKKLSSFYIR